MITYERYATLLALLQLAVSGLGFIVVAEDDLPLLRRHNGCSGEPIVGDRQQSSVRISSQLFATSSPTNLAIKFPSNKLQERELFGTACSGKSVARTL